MAIPLIVPIVAGIIVGGGAVGTSVYVVFSDSNIEDIVKSVKNAKYPHEYDFLRQIYFENYPKHTDEHFNGFLEWFIAGVVSMRAAGELAYSDYANTNELAIQKVWDTYKVNNPKPTFDVIYYAFNLLIRTAWETEKGMKALKNAETQNFIQTMRNAIQRKIYNGKETEFVNEYSQQWMTENASGKAALEKAAEAMPSIPSIGNSGKFLLPALAIAGFFVYKSMARR